MKLEDFVEYSMLGDGTLRCLNGKGVFYRLTQVARHKDYIDYVSSHFPSVKHYYYEKRADGKNAAPWYVIETKSIESLKTVYTRWFIDKKKIVPGDIKLTTEGLAIWIMDDGSYNKSRKEVKLCTNAFTFDEAETLKQALFRDLNIVASIRKDSDKKHPEKFPTMYILRQSTRDLPEMVGKYILPTFQYKINPESIRVTG
jgi:hypothetical protein